MIFKCTDVSIFYGFVEQHSLSPKRRSMFALIARFRFQLFLATRAAGAVDALQRHACSRGNAHEVYPNTRMSPPSLSPYMPLFLPSLAPRLHLKVGFRACVRGGEGHAGSQSLAALLTNRSVQERAGAEGEHGDYDGVAKPAGVVERGERRGVQPVALAREQGPLHSLSYLSSSARGNFCGGPFVQFDVARYACRHCA